MGPASAASTLARQVRKMRVASPRADDIEVADEPSDDEEDDGGRQQHPLDGPVDIWGDGQR
eukprot:3664133-Lingulodinium_polyedra.AAC.1